MSCAAPYPGWSTFKQALIRVVQVVAKTQIIQTVERISLKYTNIFQNVFGELSTAVELDLKIGPHRGAGNNVQIRIEIHKGGVIHIITLASDATATATAGGASTPRSGPLLDIDTIAMTANTKFSDFLPNISERVEAVRIENREMFFTCLRSQTIEKMDPIYG